MAYGQIGRGRVDVAAGHIRCAIVKSQVIEGISWRVVQPDQMPIVNFAQRVDTVSDANAASANARGGIIDVGPCAGRGPARLAPELGADLAGKTAAASSSAANTNTNTNLLATVLRTGRRQIVLCASCSLMVFFWGGRRAGTGLAFQGLR